MNIAPSIALRLSEMILRRRWLIMALICLVVVVVEVCEHFGPAESQSTSLNDFMLEVALLGLLMPLIGGIMLSMLNRVRDERAQSDQQREVNQKLATADNWEQLTAMLLDVPRSITPITSSNLYLFNPVN